MNNLQSWKNRNPDDATDRISSKQVLVSGRKLPSSDTDQTTDIRLISVARTTGFALGTQLSKREKHKIPSRIIFSFSAGEERGGLFRCAILRNVIKLVYSSYEKDTLSFSAKYLFSKLSRILLLRKGRWLLFISIEKNKKKSHLSHQYLMTFLWRIFWVVKDISSLFLRRIILGRFNIT